MAKSLITRFRVQNFKALRDVTLDLTPVHLLIGPNDSGKTSILEALAGICRSVDHLPLSKAFLGSWTGRGLVWHGEADLPVSLEVHQESAVPLTYRLKCLFPETAREARVESEIAELPTGTTDFATSGSPETAVSSILQQRRRVGEELRHVARQVYDALAGIHYYRWDPEMLSLPVVLNAKRKYRMDPSGFGLAQCLDDILGFDPNRFLELQRRFKTIFPDVKSVKLIPESAYRVPFDNPEAVTALQDRADGKGIYFEMKEGGQQVAARQASDGVLLVLAYLALLHIPKPPPLLLLEEPENGIHPQRLGDIVKILRELAEEEVGPQIVLTTHSPYLVDLFEPREVTVCVKQADGSVAVRRLSESRKVREQMDVFTLGEIWTAIGDQALMESAAADEGTKP